MTDPIALYGTDVPPAPSEIITRGDVTFGFEDGVVRHLRVGGVEVIRAIAFLVRDRDWGTLDPVITDEDRVEDTDGLHLKFTATYRAGDARLAVDLVITVTDTGVTFAADGVAQGTFETNRAGFNVLHPINGVAGQPAQVEHSDGQIENADFPALINPWQPFCDISAITHHAGDLAVTCRFHGDVFEMEDQRQWGDASYKTYVRPLALPWPYDIADGAALTQAVAVSWNAATQGAATPTPAPVSGAVFPQTALVITPQDAVRLTAQPGDAAAVGAQRLLCHLDMTLGDVPAQLATFAALQRTLPQIAYDLELIMGFAVSPAAETQAVADAMAACDFAPDSVLVCPAVDRQSTPPGSDWPACPPLTDIHHAAAAAFGDITRGGGMVSLFTELNRKRPPVEMLDFVSHGLCPIVHAADDVSVMETLETIPHITRSARAIIGDREYRIGPATIAMRQNPYGSRTIPNPDLGRVCMADDDPRHRAAFGAAYALGLATALAMAGVSTWTPAALYGPRGVVGTDGIWPITGVLNALAALAGQPVHAADISDGIARLHVGDTVLTANLRPEPQGDLPAYGWKSAT